MAKKPHMDLEQLELFIPSFASDIATRDQRDLMERPFFSLSKRRMKPIEYKAGDTWVKITAHAEYGTVFAVHNDKLEIDDSGR